MQDIGSLHQQLVSSCIFFVGRRACFTADMTTMVYEDLSCSDDYC